jgi:hypothetical protein
MKRLTVLIGFILMTGCAVKDTFHEYKLVGFTPDVPDIKKRSIREYKNMSFDRFMKNIYAEPEERLSTQYIVDCKTISNENNLTDSNYLCQMVKIGKHWQERPYWIQRRINEKLKNLNKEIKIELNKFCISKTSLSVF